MMRPMKRVWIVCLAMLVASVPGLARAGACSVADIGSEHAVAAVEPCVQAASADMDAFRAAHPDLYQKRASSETRQAKLDALCDCCSMVATVVAPLASTPSHDDEETLPVAADLATELSLLKRERERGPPLTSLVLYDSSALYLTSARLRL